jgi:flavin reductase (DIM6/NTAB) family NADH-FMN oxidoreductase RutF
MRKDFGARPAIYPEPVLIIATYNDDGTPNAMNAAWGGIHEDTEVSICLSPEHKTVKNILKRKAFTVSFATKETVIGSDYVGIVSGNDVQDKFERAGFHAEKSSKVDAPIIKELPLCLECELKSYTEKNCECIGEIINLSIDESVMTDGKVDLTKFHHIIYDGLNHDYLAFGEKVGKAHSDGKKLK